MSAGNYFENKNFYKRYSHVESNLIKPSKFKDAPEYSIVIPTFGRADLLKEAIGSCIGQTYGGDFEILIVDNDPARENETEKLILNMENDKIAYYKNTENIGCLGNFNRCIELGRSEYLIMLHTDDLLDAEFLDTVIPLIEANPSMDMLVPGKRIFRNGAISHQKGLGFLSRLLGTGKRAVKLRPRDFGYYNIVGGPLGIVLKKSKCLDIGGFNEDLFPMSDYAFWIRMVKDHNVYYLPMELGTYRFFNNISSEKGMQQNYIENEFYVISDLIKEMSFNRIMSGYLYEYINFRANKPGLDKNLIFKTITDRPYKASIIRKFQFIHAIAGLSLSYIKRALRSKIRI
jgi:glycosyltransferase involved in cell wall biosynthesis